jgi:hypothetical protein
MESKMNERIRELAKQARDWGYAEHHGHTAQLLFEQKFAELIVKEAGALLMSPEFIGRSDLDWSMVLNEHFGVEE